MRSPLWPGFRLNLMCVWVHLLRYIYPFQVQEMEQNLPNTCKTKFTNPNHLHEFTIVISPDEGYWRGGKFLFSVSVPEEYNMAVSTWYSVPTIHDIVQV